MADTNTQTAAAQGADSTASGAVDALPVDHLDAALDAAVAELGFGDIETDATTHGATDDKAAATTTTDADLTKPDAAASGDDAKTDDDQPAKDTEGHVDDKGEPTDLGRDALAKQFPWADKRIAKQSADIRELRAKLVSDSVTIAPTPESPLSNVETIQDLDTALATARSVRDWCRDNPEGGSITKEDGSVLTLTAEQTRARLARAESVIESAPEWKSRLTSRAKDKPWELAEKVEPKMFEPNSQEAGIARSILAQCPQIKTQFPDWEHLLACAVRGYKQSQEEQGGKARYVRVELDDKGKPIIQQKKTVDDKGTNNSAQTTKPPAAPNAQRPVQKSGKTRTSESDAVAALPAGAPAADRLSALLDQAASAALAA